MVEGLGWGETMEQYGYAWFLDKFDWVSMVFREPHRARLVVRLPSLLGGYYTRYRLVRQRLDDWVFLYNIFLRLERDRGNRPRLRIILGLLVDLYLKAFR